MYGLLFWKGSICIISVRMHRKVEYQVHVNLDISHNVYITKIRFLIQNLTMISFFLSSGTYVPIIHMYPFKRISFLDAFDLYSNKDKCSICIYT